MNQAEALKRLEALEAQARVAQLEQSRHDPELRAQAAEIAARFGLDVDELIDESIEIARRIAEIGEVAWEAEKRAEDHRRAEQFGMSIDQFRAIDWDAEYQEWIADGSPIGAWRDRDWSA